MTAAARKASTTVPTPARRLRVAATWLPHSAGQVRVGEQVPGAGEQLAGDRGGGDLLPPPLGDGLEGGGELRRALGGLRRLAHHPPQPPRALLGNVPVVGDAVAATDGRVSPAQDASLRAEPNRLTAPISARMTSAVNGPMPV